MVPRYATPRDHRFRTQGPNVARIARALGMVPMPWQLETWDVGGEVTPAGLYRWPLVVVSVPRQAGKTAGSQAQDIHRCLQGPNRRVWTTAQTGQDAADKFRELVATVMASPLRELVAGRPRLQNGSMALTFVNGSTLRPHPPTRDALHGKQSDHNDVDEGWAHSEEAGQDLFQAITPTQATRPGAQTWVWSTRGDASSAWFHGLVAAGARGEPGVCLIDYGIPADADPEDLEVIARHHPALGHTITRESLEAARVPFQDDPAGWARAYGNRASGGRVRIIPTTAWDAARTLEALPAGRPTFAVAVAEDGSAGTLGVCVRDAQDRPVLEVLEHRPGRAWLARAVLELESRGDGPVAVRRRGPAGPVADALERAGVPIVDPTDTEYAAACQDLWDRLCDENATTPDEAGRTHPRALHRDSEDLDQAVDVAGRRRIGDGGWAWSHKHSLGDVSALEMGTLAAWASARAKEPLTIGRSMIRPAG